VYLLLCCRERFAGMVFVLCIRCSCVWVLEGVSRRCMLACVCIRFGRRAGWYIRVARPVGGGVEGGRVDVEEE